MLGIRWNAALRMVALAAVLGLASLGATGAQAGWTAATDLTAPNQLPAEPVVAMAPHGTTVAAFTHFDGTSVRIAAVTRDPGGTFSDVRDLSPVGRAPSYPSPGDRAYAPLLAVDRQGNATLIWMFDNSLQVRSRPAGADWGAIQTLAVSSVSAPVVAAGDHGTAVVAWVTDSNRQVAAAIKPPGASAFGAPLTVAPRGDDLCDVPHVAMDAAGDVAASWSRSAPGTTSSDFQFVAESAVKAAGAAAFDAPERRSTEGTISNCQTSLAMSRDGRVAMAWESHRTTDPVGPTLFAERSAPFATGVWGAATPVPGLTDVSGTVGHAAQLFDDAGNELALWFPGGHVRWSTRAAGGAFSELQSLTLPWDDSAPGSAAVAASGSGDAMLLVTLPGPAIYALRRPAGAGFDGLTLVHGLPQRDGASHLSMALDDQGNGFAAWGRSVFGKGELTEIAAYDPVPPVFFSVVVPATGTAGRALSMSASGGDRMSRPDFRFDFGDGTAANDATPTHAYGQPGDYTVTVTATDDAGNSTSATRPVHIVAAPAPERLRARITLHGDRLRDGGTRLRSLVVDRLDGPEVVTLRCTGHGCGRRAGRTVAVRRHGTRLSLTTYVKGLRLRPSARITVSVSRAGYVARIRTYTMVLGKAPKATNRCLAPGQTRPGTC